MKKNILLFILFILEIVASYALVICLYLFAIITIIGFSFYLGVKIIEKILKINEKSDEDF